MIDRIELLWNAEIAFVVAGSECFELSHNTEATAACESGVRNLCEHCNRTYVQAIRDGADPAQAVAAFRAWSPPEPRAAE